MAPAGHIVMSPEALEAAQARIATATALAAERERLRPVEPVQSRETEIDVGTGVNGTPPLTPEELAASGMEQFGEEETRQADQDILLGLREIAGAELVKWKVFRVADPSGRKPLGYLSELGTTLLSHEKIKRDFGMGTYRIKGTYPNGRYAAQRTIEIAADPEPVTETAQPTGSGSMQDIMLMMRADAQTRREEDAQRRRDDEAREERRRRERMEMLTVLSPVLASVAAALLGNKGPDIAALVQAVKPAPQPTLLETMQALRELTPAPVANTGPTPIDTALKLFDKFTDMAPKGGDGGTGWADVLKEVVRSVGPGVAPMVGQLAAAAASARARQQTSPPSQGAPARIAGPPDLYGGMQPIPESESAPGALTDSSETQSPEERAVAQGDDVGPLQMIRMVPWLKEQLNTLVQKAQRGSDPDLYAEVVLDSLPENIHGDVLLDFLKRPDWFNLMAQFDPRVRDHSRWFGELRASIISTGERIKAELTEAPASAPAAPAPIPAAKSAPISGADKPTGPPSLGG